MTQLLYLVRPGEDNAPLKYSLRSIKKYVADPTVVIAGHKPRWVWDAHHIPVSQQVQHHRNQLKILKEVAKAELPGGNKFILMNDDFFALHPVKEVPQLIYNGTLDDLSERGAWKRGFYAQSLENTKNLLYKLGVKSNLAFDGVHQPMPMDQEALAEVLAHAGDQDVQHRSLYGNLVHEWGLVPRTPAMAGSDAKVRVPRKNLPDAQWVSCSRRVWKSGFRRLIHDRFPEKSLFEGAS